MKLLPVRIKSISPLGGRWFQKFRSKKETASAAATTVALGFAFYLYFFEVYAAWRQNATSMLEMLKTDLRSPTPKILRKFSSLRHGARLRWRAV